MKVDAPHDFSPSVVTESQRACYALHLDDSVCLLIFHIAKVSPSPSHIHVRVTLVIRWLFAARFVDVDGWNFQVHGWNTAKAVFSRDVSLCCAMGKRAKQSGTRPPQSLNTEKVKHTYDSALREGPKFWIQRYHDFNTAHVGSPRDISLDTTTGSVRRCCAVHVACSACLPMCQEHGQYALQACCTSVESHPHEQAREARRGPGLHALFNSVSCSSDACLRSASGV